MSEAPQETATHEDPLAFATRAERSRYILAREETGERWNVDERMVLGSSAGVDLQVHDRTVSRLHAELAPRPDGLYVQDLDSSNGTFIEGVRVGVARLASGQRLRVGTTSFLLETEEPISRESLWPSDRYGPLIGRSEVMRDLFRRIARIAATESTVLLQGETGTGKELVASAIHDASGRGTGPFVVVDCASLPANLLEGELFGHVKGAFTGASSERPGAIEAASGGTLFLDEIGELPLSMQPSLLRVLESRKIRRLGETRMRDVDLRVVAATHRDLRAMVNEGTFREDLYFRLAVIPLFLPPLRDRQDDIPLLVQRFLPAGATLPAAVMEQLSRRAWQGNVRELRNWVERIVALGPAALDLPDATTPPSKGSLPKVDLDEPFKAQRERWLTHLEREYVAGLLDRHHGEVTAAADAAGLDKSYIHRLARKHRL